MSEDREGQDSWVRKWLLEFEGKMTSACPCLRVYTESEATHCRACHEYAGKHSPACDWNGHVLQRELHEFAMNWRLTIGSAHHDPKWELP